MSIIPHQKRRPQRQNFVTSLLRNNRFPSLIQFIGLIAFFGLAICGFFGPTEFRYANITSFWVWCLWWPGLILAVLLSSRSWCSICPLRYVANKTDRVGLNLAIPKVLKKHRVIIIAGFFTLHTVIVSYNVHHFSSLTSAYLLSLLGFALIVSLMFEKNAFCNSFCPLNGFIGAYSNLGCIELSSTDKAVCRTCRTKECFHHCPSSICMGATGPMEECVMCFDCVKKCPNENIRLGLRSPLKSLWKHKGSLSTLMVVVVLLGIMLDEFGEEWGVIEHLVTFVPGYLASVGVPKTIWGYHWLDSTWVIFLLPLIIVMATAVTASLITRRKNIMGFAITYAPGLLPLIFSAHLAKMIDTINTTWGYGKYIATDPLGRLAAQRLTTGTFTPATNLFLSSTAEGYLLFAIIAVGFLASLFVISKLGKGCKETHEGRLGALAFQLMTILLGTSALCIIINWFALM